MECFTHLWDIFHMYLRETGHRQCLNRGGPSKRNWKVAGRTFCQIFYFFFLCIGARDPDIMAAVAASVLVSLEANTVYNIALPPRFSLKKTQTVATNSFSLWDTLGGSYFQRQNTNRIRAFKDESSAIQLPSKVLRGLAYH